MHKPHLDIRHGRWLLSKVGLHMQAKKSCVGSGRPRWRQMRISASAFQQPTLCATIACG